MDDDIVDFIIFHCEDTTLDNVKVAVSSLNPICVEESEKFFFIGFSSREIVRKQKENYLITE